MEDSDYNDTDYVNEAEEDLPLATAVIYGIIVPCLVIVCIVGNILTIASFVKDSKLQTVYNTYIISMATADLLIGTISMPFYAVYTFMNYYWPFGPAFCKMYSSVDYLACLESVLIIILISYDRCMLLKQGAEYSVKQTKLGAKVRIILSWILAFLIYVPAIIFWDIVRGFSAVDPEDCDVEFFNDFVFIVISAILEFLVPLISIASLNAYLYILIRNLSRKKSGQFQNKLHIESQKSQVPVHTISLTTPKSGQTPTYFIDKLKKSDTDKAVSQRNNKAARSLAILVAVFTICWMPYTICTVVFAFCPDCVDGDFYEASNWLLWSKSSLNPFLYAFTNQHFRNNFKSLLGLQKWVPRKRKIGPQNHTEGTVETVSTNRSKTSSCATN